MIKPVNRNDLLRQVGYKNPPDRKLLHLIDEMLELGNGCIEPVMRSQEIAGAEGLPLFLRGAALRYVALAAIGERLEALVKECFDSGKAAEGYLLDTIGSVAVMHVGDALWAQILEDAAARGFAKGMRRAPGCTGVPMDVQKWIVDTLHDPQPPVHVTPSYMLVPRKSLAFLGRFGGNLGNVFSCKGCRQHAGCTLRE